MDANKARLGVWAALLAGACLNLPYTSAQVLPSTPYEYFLAGNPGGAPGKTTPGFLLAGGGKDQDEAFRWFIGRSGGRIVVLRASGGDAYNAYLRGLGGVDSVESIVIKTPEAAAHPFVSGRIDNAGAIFIAGGDQWNYLRLWRNGPIGKALQAAIDRGVPVGGSSAGLAVLGEYVFTAEQDTVTSTQALADPFNPHVTVGTDFLRIPLLRNLITDTHFSRRDRMGRTLVFLARMLESGKMPVARAIAVDERTAGLLEAGGQMTIAGEGAAYLISVSRPPEICKPGAPLTMRGIAVVRVDRHGSFDVKQWKARNGAAYGLSVENGKIVSTQQNGSIY